MPVGDFYQEYGPMQRRRSGEEPEPDEERPKKQHPRRRRPIIRRPPPRRTIIGIVLALLAMPLILPYAIGLFYYGRALPGVSVQGIPVANFEKHSIDTIVSARYAQFERNPLVLSYADFTWNPSLDALGVTFDSSKTAETALHAGRHGNPVKRLLELITLWRTGIDVSPQLTIDMPQLQDYLLTLTSQIEYPPRNAMLSIAEGKVVGIPGATGRQLLIDETANDIMLALQTLEPRHVVVRTRELEPIINNAALEVAQAQAQNVLGTTLVFTRSAESDRMWEWDSQKLTRLLQVDTVDNHLVVRIDRLRLAKAVEHLAEEMDADSQEPRLRFSEGEVRIFEEGHVGWKLQQAAALHVISTTLQQQNALLSRYAVVLPIETIHPVIKDEALDTLGIEELIAEGKSSFAGSADYRITNILAGAARFDGVLIPPGKEFSFNSQLGEVTEEQGFVEGYAVIGNRTQLEWGGGVCQVSTTVFRAAFWAGLPITERHAHPFYISWYDDFAYGEYGDGPGIDATIYTGSSDFKFINDTGHWLLMHVDVDEAEQVLTVRLYGTKPERQVTFDGPEISNIVQAPVTPIYIDDPTLPAGTTQQSDVARNGRDIVVYRIIEDQDGNTEREKFFTRFKAWPNVFRRGTGTNANTAPDSQP